MTSLDVLNAAVRPIVTLMVVATLCLAFLVGIYRGEIEVDVAAFVGIVSMVVAFWFSQRQAAKDSTAPTPPSNGPPR